MRVSAGKWCLMALAGLAVGGCASRAELGERRVLAMTTAMERAEGHEAYLRAEKRSEGVKRGMSGAEVEEELDAFIAVETRDNPGGKPIERRATLIEGRLCVLDLSERKQRWVFGYDEGRVVFVGFVLEFKRDGEGDAWELRRVDRQPRDSCESKG